MLGGGISFYLCLLVRESHRVLGFLELYHLLCLLIRLSLPTISLIHSDRSLRSVVRVIVVGVLLFLIWFGLGEAA